MGLPANVSSGLPSVYCATTPLYLVGVSPPFVNSIRVAYARQGIGFSGASTSMSDAQFVNCQNALICGGTTTTLRNVLFVNSLTNFAVNSGGVSLSVENATFSPSGYLETAPGAPKGTSLTLTICVLVKIPTIS